MPEESAECTQSQRGSEPEDRQYSRLCMAIVRQTIIDATSSDGSHKEWEHETKLRNHISVARNSRADALRFLQTGDFREIHAGASLHFYPPDVNLIIRKIREFQSHGITIRWEHGRAILMRDGVETVVNGWEMN